MAISFRRILLHSSLLVLALVTALALFPLPASAGCYGGYCPSGEDDDSDSRVEVHITFHVMPEGAGTIEVNGDELAEDVFVAFQGDVLQLEAIPEDGYEFNGWTGSFTSAENPWETPFYNHKELTANFVAVKEDLSRDANGLTVNIPETTEALDADGEELDGVSIRVKKSHDIPDAMALVSSVYDLSPDGATFDPPVTIELEYDDGSVPSGVDADELSVAWFDEASDAWELLPSSVDERDGIVAAEVAHLSEFCVLAPLPEEAAAPAATSGSSPAPLTSPGFSLSGLEVTPSSALLGESVSISLQAQYAGSETQGASRIVLRVDGTVVDEQQVTLGAGEGGKVAFTYTPSAEGAHEIDVNGLQTGFSVGPAAPIALAEAVSRAKDDSFALPQVSAPSLSGVRWQPVAIVSGAIILAALAFAPLIRRRILRYRYDI